MSALFGWGNHADLDIEFTSADKRKRVTMKKDNESPAENLLLYLGKEDVDGTVHVRVPQGKRLDHTGIKVELVGQIELAYDRSSSYIFTSLVHPLEQPGSLNESKSYPFNFSGVEKAHETYNGINVRLRYFIRVTIGRPYASDLRKETDFAVQNLSEEPEINNSIKMEVGIEDCLHIEFEYNKSKYNLDDVVIGKIFFLLVRIKIKHMEIQILRRESTGSGPNTYNETDVLTKFEIMDGAPMRGESIPIRLFLSPFELTPTYKNIHGKFNVKYYLNLVLVDEEERRYFKQQEISLWRKTPKASELTAPADS